MRTKLWLRQPDPPFARIAELDPAGSKDQWKYDFKLRGIGTMSFYLSRNDVAKYRDAIYQIRPPMVTAERDDGALPWAGFINHVHDDQDDPLVLYQCVDHAFRLSSPNGARTYFSTTVIDAGTGIRQLFQDAADRAEPPFYLNLEHVGNGPTVSYPVRADYLLDFLNKLSEQANWEWALSHNIAAAVETYLVWTARVGIDRRDGQAWSHGQHFASAVHDLDYANGIAAALAVGSGNAFDDRSAAVVSDTGKSSDNVPAYAQARTSPYGMGGSRVDVSNRSTDPSVLRERALQMRESPEWAVEQFGVTVAEDKIEWMDVGVGDTRTIRFPRAAIGPIERPARIIGIQMYPNKGVHDIELAAA